MTDDTLPETIARSWRRERPDLDQLGLSFTLRIRALAMVIDHVIEEIAAQEAIHLDDLLLLFSLRRGGPPYCVRPTDVYRILNVTSGAATYRIARLVERGLGERVADPEDKRGYLLRISDLGMGVVDRAVEALAHQSTRALEAAGLDAVGTVALGASLRALERGWETIVPEDENPLARRRSGRR